MTWIKTLSFDEADERLRAAMEAQHGLYPVEYATPVHPTADGQTAGIVASHSLIPEACRHAFATFGALMAPDLPLARRQHEMIATVVSVTNRCHY
jgi:alkylhydroperoxidase family enzyme